MAHSIISARKILTDSLGGVLNRGVLEVTHYMSGQMGQAMQNRLNARAQLVLGLLPKNRSMCYESL